MEREEGLVWLLARLSVRGGQDDLERICGFELDFFREKIVW